MQQVHLGESDVDWGETSDSSETNTPLVVAFSGGLNVKCHQPYPLNYCCYLLFTCAQKARLLVCLCTQLVHSDQVGTILPSGVLRCH